MVSLSIGILVLLSPVQNQIQECPRSVSDVLSLISILEQARICRGHPDVKYTGLVAHRNGKFYGNQGMLLAFEDLGTLDKPTIRSSHSTDKVGVNLNNDMHDDVCTIMKQQNDDIVRLYPEGSFQRLFWSQQLDAARVKNASSMKWHPLMIKWCLYLRYKSSGAYEALKESGCLKLPSQRTLRDYTHVIKAANGFTLEGDEQLVRVAELSTLKEWQKCVVLVIDEMFIREDLVYDKNNDELIGFTDLGDINNHLVAYEKSIKEDTAPELANSMLVFMVTYFLLQYGRLYLDWKGVDLRSTTSIENSKKLFGFKGQTYVADLYYRDREKGMGLLLLPKIKLEHIQLTSFSRMRVDLAAQLLSETVAKALRLSGDPAVQETAQFVSMFDKFFDALNVSNYNSGVKKKKTFQQPYRSGDDFRLKWLKDEFLVYLDTWEQSIKAREGFNNDEKKKMHLSPQTLLGLRITIYSFVELVQYLFTLDGVESFLSQKISQDPLEKFFGCQRQRGATSDNPNVSEFRKNLQTIRIVDTMCRSSVRGNCRGVKDDPIDIKENTPLLKRKSLKRKRNVVLKDKFK
eukprot:Em0003g638a